MKCSFCGCDRHSSKRAEYVYSLKGKKLIVPNTPVDVCDDCGMYDYDVSVLKEIERHVFAIENKSELPDRNVQIPEKTYAKNG